MTKSQLRPEPVVVSTVCSLCGELWEPHGPNPTTLDCIRVLKAKMATAWWYTTVGAAGGYNPYQYQWTYNQNTLYDGHAISCTTSAPPPSQTVDTESTAANAPAL